MEINLLTFFPFSLFFFCLEKSNYFKIMVKGARKLYLAVTKSFISITFILTKFENKNDSIIFDDCDRFYR